MPHAGGAPTKYTAEMCDKVREFGKLGYHITEMCAALDVCVQTIYNWSCEHKEFLEAFTRAREDGIAFWLKFGQDNIKERFFNDRIYEILLRHKCHLTHERRIKIKALDKTQTHNEQMDVIIDMLNDGDIAPNEAKTLAEVVKARANVDEVTELRKSIEKYEKEAK